MGSGNKIFVLIFFATAVSLLTVTNGAKILFLFTLCSHSHRVAIQPLITAMAERNHEVTVFSPIRAEEPNPKIKEFCTDSIRHLNDLMHKDSSAAAALGRLKDRHFDPFWNNKLNFEIMFPVVNAALRDPEFMKWIENSNFDLILYDMAGKEFIYPLAYKMKTKLISFTTLGSPLPWELDLYGLPAESWFEDVVGNSYSWLPTRFFNAINGLDWLYGYKTYYLPKVEALAREVFKFDFPPLEELFRTHTELVFLNEHFSAGFPRAFPPFVIPVGGMHAKVSNGTLPKELEDFISDAEEFVFISFGSIIRVSQLPKSVQQTMFDAVASFKNSRFFWKWEGELPNNFPTNVLAKKWFPQQDLLANRKCIGFVTQGGVMSVQQAIFHGVPMVVVPGFGDQAYNARAAVHHGYGIHLELADLTEETFRNAINEILRNKKYATTVMEVSRRFKDRPISAVETGVWWMEYVLRHDTSHLKSEAIRQTWWQRRSLDFWVLVFAVVVVYLGLSLLLVLGLVKIALSSKSGHKYKQS